MGRLICGDAREILGGMDRQLFHSVITSPPYWGLRDYGCPEVMFDDGWIGQFGLEPTPEMYVEHTLEFLRAIRRVLRDDGTCWWVIGDSYAGSWGDSGHRPERTGTPGHQRGKSSEWYERKGHPQMNIPPSAAVTRLTNLKPKDLVMIPFRVALAAQGDKEPITLIKDRAWAAWFAGIIDGEGTIGIHRTARADGWIQVTPYITVKMSDLEALDKIVDLTAIGRVRENNDAGKSDARGIRTRRNTSTWRVEGELAMQIIRDIYPWLTIKERQARIAYELWRVIGEKKSAKGTYGKLREGDTEYRDELWRMMKGCNQREWQGDVPFPAPPQNFIDYSWWVRSVIIWSKPNPMPESVRDRPTTAHEYVLLLTKSARYFYDADAIREPGTEWRGQAGTFSRSNGKATNLTIPGQTHVSHRDGRNDRVPTGRNKRTVWEIATQPYGGPHYATFPPKLVEPMILTTPTKVCAECGTGWERVIERQGSNWENRKAAGAPLRYGLASSKGTPANRFGEIETETLGFRPTCSCPGLDGDGPGSDCADYDTNWPTKPAVILDPFCGTGTTLWQANALGRAWIGIDIDPKSIEMAKERLGLFITEEDR